MNAPGRTLPHNLDAERSVLGAILIEQTAVAYDEAAALVSAKQFFRDAHRRIFEAMGALASRRSAVDLVTLTDQLQRASGLEDVGGAAYIASLIDGVPRSVNLPYYASIVVEKAKYRELIYGANRIIADAYEAELNADEAIDRAEALMMDIGRSAARSEFVLADDWVRELYTVIGHAIETKRVVTGVPTSLSKLDRYTRGLQPSDLILLAARPSVGKTAMALQMALYAAEHAMTGFVSLEMSRRMVGLRAVALEGRVDAFKLMTGFLSDNEQGRVAHAMERIASKRLAIDDASGLTASQLRAKVRRLKARYGLGIVFIDYLQLVRLGEKSENRNLELSAISASLKDLAKDLDIPVVVLSQLSRDAARTNRRPALHDLRDSGALEQDADLVMLIHRPNQGDDAKRMDDGEDVEIIIAKQRNGPVGVVKLHWIAEQMRFGEATESPEQDRML